MNDITAFFFKHDNSVFGMQYLMYKDIIILTHYWLYFYLLGLSDCTFIAYWSLEAFRIISPLLMNCIYTIY